MSRLRLSISPADRLHLLHTLMATSGYDAAEQEQYDDCLALWSDDACEGICAECDEVWPSEPDADSNWCAECHQSTVISGLVLAEVL